MTDYIKEEDTLNDGRKKLNNAIKAFNETVVEGDSSVEAAQARVDKDGKTYGTLKQRLDTEQRDTEDKMNEFKGEINNRVYDTVLGINNNTISLNYDSNGALLEILEINSDTETVRSIHLSYSNDLLSQVVETIDGKTVKSALDYIDGELSTITKEVI